MILSAIAAVPNGSSAFSVSRARHQGFPEGEGGSVNSTEKVKSFGQNTLFERPAQLIELARIFVFLASADASYVSGEVYGATGGRTPL
jgi:NAD(P)-dependent dehydrogenase (short-subunit alcohol dehydrogenase family)